MDFVGKNDQKIWIQFLREIFLPNPATCNLLLLDSYGVHCDENTIKQLLEEGDFGLEKLVVKIIPPNTTYELQSLERYFFRMYKHTIRHIFHNVDFDDLSDTLQQRNNILKLQSLVYQKFPSPRFQQAHGYGWVLAGLGSRSRQRFQNITE